VTAQTPEKIIYQGEKLNMCTEPLEDYFSKGGTRPKFQLSHTALWRRYIGYWEVVDDRLYLTDLSGWLEDGTKATVARIFPGFPDKVFAQWFSGTLHIPQGKALKYIHLGYGSRHERDLLVDVLSGIVVATTVRCIEDETTDEDDDLPF
jgi:hypothetical protein